LLDNKRKSSKRDKNLVIAAQTERRCAQRFRVNWEVTARGIDGKGRIFDESGCVQNLSSTGALIILPRSPGSDDRLCVQITIPVKTRGRIVYAARVARIEEMGHQAAVAMVFEAKRPSFMES